MKILKSASMDSDTKRKWRWSSNSLVASGQPTKVLVVDRSMLSPYSFAADQIAVHGLSLDGCSMEEAHERPGLAARMRRHGSRFLSIVGFQRSSGMLFCPHELPITECDQICARPSVRQIPQVTEMLLWP